MSISDIHLIKFLESNKVGSSAATAANKAKDTVHERILVKSAPSREMCIMLQNGQESSFDRFLKFYLPPKSVDSLANKSLEDKVALTYSIVSYYNQLSAGVHEAPPSHLSFLRVRDPTSSTLPSPPVRPGSPQPVSPQPHSPGLRLPNISTFNHGNLLLNDTCPNIASSMVSHSLGAIPRKSSNGSQNQNSSSSSGIEDSSIVSISSAESDDLMPRKPGRPSKRSPRSARLSGKYICSHCSKGFPQNSQLDQHLRVHTGEKPYPCQMCDSRFKQLCHLKQHMRAKHTGERPYHCRLCDKKFVQMCHLQQHERSSNHLNGGGSEMRSYNATNSANTVSSLLSAASQVVSGTVCNDITNSGGITHQQRSNLMSVLHQHPPKLLVP